MIEEGKAAPLFTLKDANGEKVALKDLRGRNVIVFFYPRDNTPGCTKEACGFRDSWKQIQKQNCMVLGISPDSEASHEEFVAQFKLPFELTFMWLLLPWTGLYLGMIPALKSQSRLMLGIPFSFNVTAKRVVDPVDPGGQQARDVSQA
jgi:hypothetical protein